MTKFIKSVQILLFLLFLVFITKNVYCDDSDDECSSYFGSDDENDTDTGSDTEESDVEPPAENNGGYWSDDSLDGINVDNLPDIPTDTDDDDDDYDGNDDDDE
uniref:Uncharacterized protein n=1 Tax=Meloidogyne enterolobii TaxID=390850 RepID=A0A6V7TPB0_MELEN|nr:unnamed protein product [Meloidogyne enterolobii]